MVKYFFVTNDGEIYINLPLLISRTTLCGIKNDLHASAVYYYAAKDVKLFLDF